MEEARKNYYPIPEAARLKGISEEELCRGIREGRIPSKQIGLRMMVPAAGVFGDTAGQDGTDRGARYLEQTRGDLLKALESAPEYGSCGIAVAFHAGKITKVSVQSEATRLGEKSHD